MAMFPPSTSGFVAVSWPVELGLGLGSCSGSKLMFSFEVRWRRARLGSGFTFELGRLDACCFMQMLMIDLVLTTDTPGESFRSARPVALLEKG